MDIDLQRYARAAWATLTPSERQNITLKQFAEFVNEQFSSSYNPIDLMPILEQLRAEAS